MPWKQLNVMDQRKDFIEDWLSGGYTVTSLSRHYGISRPCAYKWITRFRVHGMDGLIDRSRRPHCCPTATPESVRDVVIKTKLAHQDLGPKKVVDLLKRLYPQIRWPADSTAGEILKRAGLVKSRKARLRVKPDSQVFKDCDQPNRVWSADFKGQFRLGDGQWCYPLTLSDNYSHYFLVCQALPSVAAESVIPWFEWAFRCYGLPQAIRTDNGPPFASRGLGGISRLSMWWIQLGIKPERIKPATPGHNGRHERLHRTLKDAVINPPAADFTAQQRLFDDYLVKYNELRSHESLNRDVPAEHYHRSSRPYPPRPRAIEYPSQMQTRWVGHNGEIKFKGKQIYCSQNLAKQTVGLRQIEASKWQVYYSFHLLGILDEQKGTIKSWPHWHELEDN